jgi:hypothetical protein
MLAERQWAIADAIRQVRNKMTDTNRYEYRYEERDGMYSTRAWNNGREISERRELSQRPKWMTDIINLAVVGGHAKKVPNPPPELIVWFRVNEHRELIEFIDFNNTLEGNTDDL